MCAATKTIRTLLTVWISSAAASCPPSRVLNLTGEWRFAPGWELFGRINNVFDKRYATGGLLAENAFDSAGAIQPPANWRNEQFNTPAAPRSAWVGVRWNFGAR